LTQQLSTIEEAIYQVKNRSEQDPLNFPIKLNNKIGALGTLIGIGQYPPTAQDYTVFTRLSNALQTQLTALDQTISTGVPALNRTLTAAKLEPVTPKPRAGV
jgi:hypothetical protein